jgi:NAD(P)-dependent dehydrogenase (short-subunit alcohol dehydrogenase family)
MTRRVLVTGGSSGIGAAICRRFAADGWTVAVAGRSPERTQMVADELGGIAVLGDAADTNHDPVAAALDDLGGLDCVILNAGVITDADLPTTTAADWQHLLEINVLATHCPRRPHSTCSHARVAPADQLGCRRLGRERDRRLLDHEAHGAGVDALPRRRMGSRRHPRQRSLPWRYGTRHGHDHARAA